MIAKVTSIHTEYILDDDDLNILTSSSFFPKLVIEDCAEYLKKTSYLIFQSFYFYCLRYEHEKEGSGYHWNTHSLCCDDPQGPVRSYLIILYPSSGNKDTI
jgi:hypothetical protein